MPNFTKLLSSNQINSFPKCSDYFSRKEFIEGEFKNITKLYSTPKTQKANGVFLLESKRAKLKSHLGWLVPKHLIFKAGEQFTFNSFNWPVFVRPCPIVPRHGFVESSTYLDCIQLNKLSQKTYEVEHDAELLITKPIDAAYNAIIANNVITFSQGNDGATSGRNCLHFYINDDPFGKVLGSLADLVPKHEVPFYEAVLDKDDQQYLVQVRSGPAILCSKNYVPTTLKVQNIIRAEGDLLDWEKKLKDVDPANTIIDHSEGSLSSHYAIHAIINKVAVFTQNIPKVGDLIAPTTNATITSKEQDIFREGFLLGFSAAKNLGNSQGITTSYLMRKILKLSLATLHNFSSIASHNDYSNFGITLGLFLRCAFAISIGEARHYKYESTYDNDRDFTWINKLSKHRLDCYDYVFYELDPREVVVALAEALEAFKLFNWNHAYGGEAWADCTQKGALLYNACLAGDIENAARLFNIIINIEHNNGLYLNKICGIDDFNEAEEKPAEYAIINLNDIVKILYSMRAYSEPYQAKRLVALGPIEIECSPFKITSVYVSSNSSLLDEIEAHVELVLRGNIINKTIYLNKPHTGFKSQSLKSENHWWTLQNLSGETIKVISKNKVTSSMKQQLY